MEIILETEGATILQLICGLRGSLLVTLEEGTWAAWLYDLLKPHVSEVLVCDPRKYRLGRVDNKNDSTTRANWRLLRKAMRRLDQTH